jgi:aspartyl/asparaginyl-tRNA synthetase
MIEPEICFAQLPELFELIEQYIKYCLDYCFQNIKDDLDYFESLYLKKENTLKQDTFSSLLAYLRQIVETPF